MAHQGKFLSKLDDVALMKALEISSANGTNLIIYCAKRNDILMLEEIVGVLETDEKIIEHLSRTDKVKKYCPARGRGVRVRQLQREAGALRSKFAS